MKFWHLLQHRWALKTLDWVKEATHKRALTVWFLLYEMSRTGKSIETESSRGKPAAMSWQTQAVLCRGLCGKELSLQQWPVRNHGLLPTAVWVSLEADPLAPGRPSDSLSPQKHDSLIARITQLTCSHIPEPQKPYEIMFIVVLSCWVLE